MTVIVKGDRVRIERLGERGWKGTVVGSTRRGTALLVQADGDGPIERVPTSCVALLTKPKAPVLDDGDADTIDQNEVKT